MWSMVEKKSLENGAAEVAALKLDEIAAAIGKSSEFLKLEKDFAQTDARQEMNSQLVSQFAYV
jgi:hypothetical protein